MTAPVEVRRLAADDLEALTAAVDRARDAGDFRASADAEGRFILRAARADPSHVALAWTGAGDLVGFGSSEFKVVVDPAHRRRGIGRQLVEALVAIVVEDPDDPDRLIGFCSTEPDRRDGVVAPIGEIWTIGVRPERQGTGLGRQLLRWGVGRLRSIGVETAKLSVNGRNERALGLYEAEGFLRNETRERWARTVDSEEA